MKKYKVQQVNGKPNYTPCQNQEGVFEIKKVEFICRVKIKLGYSTLSKHKTEAEAEEHVLKTIDEIKALPERHVIKSWEI